VKGEQVEHVKHTIYLFYRKSQGLWVLITKKLTLTAEKRYEVLTYIIILKTYADDVIIKQNYFWSHINSLVCTVVTIVGI